MSIQVWTPEMGFTRKQPVVTNRPMPSMLALLSQFTRKQPVVTKPTVTQGLIDSTIAERQVFKERVNQMWQEKQAWKQTTQRLAQEVLK